MSVFSTAAPPLRGLTTSYEDSTCVGTEATMDNLIPVREELIPVTVNLTSGEREFMRASATATGRSVSNWLRRVLDGLQAGTVGPVRPGAAAPAVPATAPGRQVLAHADAPPEGLEWMLVTVVAADVGREAWMRAGDAVR
jgi:hypothetical protein